MGICVLRRGRGVPVTIVIVVVVVAVMSITSDVNESFIICPVAIA